MGLVVPELWVCRKEREGEMTTEPELDIKIYPHLDGVEAFDTMTTMSVVIHGVSNNGRGTSATADIFIPGYNSLIGQQISLSDISQRDRAIDAITLHYPEYRLFLPRIIERASQEALALFSTIDTPFIHNINTEPESLDLEHLFCINGDLLQRILPKGQHTTIFSQGGAGKSLIGADYLPLLYTLGVVPENGVFYPLGLGNVLVCDWETDAQIHKRYIRAIKAGVSGLPLNDAIIHYMNMDSPLTIHSEFLKEFIREKQIDLLVIDSQMASMSGAYPNLNDAQVAGIYYNLLTSFNVTTLTIDHVPKSNMNTDNGAGAAYGSVVKYNRARTVFELKQASEPGEPFIELAFVQQKNNLGMKLKPFGVRIDYNNDDAGILQAISIQPLDLSTSGKLEGVRPNWERIRDFIIWDRSGLPATPKDIAAAIEVGEKVVRTTLNRYKEIFVVVGGDKNGQLWGVLKQ